MEQNMTTMAPQLPLSSSEQTIHQSKTNVTLNINKHTDGKHTYLLNITSLN